MRRIRNSRLYEQRLGEVNGCGLEPEMVRIMTRLSYMEKLESWDEVRDRKLAQQDMAGW
jgi:hypothetical protein